jgi:hypothetical protein
VCTFKDYVTDLDEKGPNTAHKFGLTGNIEASDSLKDKVTATSNCENHVGRLLFCVTGNGSVTLNVLFQSETSGYFRLPVYAEDVAGNTTAIVEVSASICLHL